MIAMLSSKDVRQTLSGITTISDIVTLYSQKPHDEWVEANHETTSYGWIDIISDTPNTPSNRGWNMSDARVSITIIAPHSDHIPGDLLESDVINNIISTISNEIVAEGCEKIQSRGFIGNFRVRPSTTSPILYNEKDRAVRVQDYFITYNR